MGIEISGKYNILSENPGEVFKKTIQKINIQRKIISEELNISSPFFSKQLRNFSNFKGNISTYIKYANKLGIEVFFTIESEGFSFRDTNVGIVFERYRIHKNFTKKEISDIIKKTRYGTLLSSMEENKSNFSKLKDICDKIGVILKYEMSFEKNEYIKIKGEDL